eukprot:Gb_13590 [translate_table: standard]
MVRSAFWVLSQLLFFSLLTFSCGIAFGDGSGDDCSESFSSHKVVNRKIGEPSNSVRFRLMHKLGKCSPFRNANSTWESTISEMIKADAKRYNRIEDSMARSHSTKTNEVEDSQIPLASGKGAINAAGNYIIQIAFGTPGQSQYTVIDTGSDVNWIPCIPCMGCNSSTAPPFDSSKSSSYELLGCASAPCTQLPSYYRDCSGNSNCSFQLGYADKSEVGGLLSSDELTLGSEPVSKLYFGCANVQTGIIQSEPGLIGLALSTEGLKFTPLLTNSYDESAYYISLKGISVGGELLSIPPETFALDGSTGRGTIIDSGNVITRLVEPAYTALRDAFRSKLSNLQDSLTSFGKDFDTCYNVASPASINTPTITFHFEGGLDLDLAQENILYQEDDKSPVCLAFALPPKSLSTLSSFGNVQQQNWRIVYDVPHSQLGFAPERCSD